MRTTMKRLLSMVLAVVMLVSLLPGTVVSAANDGAASGSSEVSSTQRPAGSESGSSGTAEPYYAGNTGKDVLVIQTRQAWESYANEETLNSLSARGFHDGFTVVTVAQAVNVRFADYSMVIYANDQASDTYSQYDLIRVALEQYIYNGGVVLFGACDQGWAGGYMSQDLPGGVRKQDDFAYTNYIADADHPIVTGTLTGGTPLTNAMLNSNFCSHISFVPGTLPAGHNVILRSSETDAPTLVEYPYGKGRVIASGLTWEFDYNYQSNGYSRNSIDDYFAYGLKLAGVVYDAPEDVDAISFPYDENTRYEDLAEKCVTYSLLAYRETDQVKKNGRPAYYVSGKDGTLLGKLLHADGYKDLESYYYKALSGDHITAKKTGEAGEHTSPYTIGHRKIKDKNGNIYDQVVIVFRGTYDQEWYGNFDLTGATYNAACDYSWTFQNAVDLAMEGLAKYITEMKNAGKMGSNNLKVLLTGHSRGAAVANMMAHELTDLSNNKGGRNSRHFSGISFSDIYAYTFATPNVASYNKITSYDSYNNIFNFCFTDDFVPNLPLESWGWGKYGQTYWKAAADLKSNNTFYSEAQRFFGEKPSYKTSYTENIAYTMSDATKATRFRYSEPIRNYYDYGYMFGIGNKITLHDFIRTYLGGSMQVSDKDAATTAKTALVTTALNYVTVASCLKDLSWNLVKGSSLDDVLDIYTNGTITTGFRADFKMNGPLNYAHQCGSYYTAIRTMFNSFKFHKLTNKGYAATKYSDGLENDGVTPDETQIAALKAFLETPVVDAETGIETTNAGLLGWEIDDVSTWEGVIWNNGSIVSLDMHYTAVTGELDLSAFPYLSELNVRYCALTGLTGIGSTMLTKLDCSGNELTELDFTGASLLTTLCCTNNPLAELDLTDCTALEELECISCGLTELKLNSDALVSLTCSNNYLDTEDAELNAIVDALTASEDGYADFLPQNIPADAAFDADDLAALLALANTDANLEILGWDLENPATWSGVEWILDNGVYHLETLSLADLELTGEADFSGCDYLTYLVLSNNGFTGLVAEDCDNLESFWVDYNYLSENELTQFVEETGIENYKIGDQRSLKDLNADDVALLNALAEALDQNWDPELYANNPAMGWTEGANGIWNLTALDLSGLKTETVLDLSMFRNLKEIRCTDSDITELILPEGMTSIPEGAFANNTSLKTVVMPVSLREIGDNAFEGCARLALVDFLGKAPQLGDDCFVGCRENLVLNLHFDFDTYDLFVGETLQLDASAFPNGEIVEWGTSKEEVATVDEAGLITAVSHGTALISASCESGFTATCTVVVPDHTHEFTYLDNGDGTHTKACESCERIVTETHTYVDSFCICGAEKVHEHTYRVLEFVWNDDFTCDAQVICDCGEETTVACDVTVEIVEPTCTEGGVATYTAFCLDATDTMIASIDALGHDYESIVTEPTCIEEGYTAHTCTRCGDTYVDTYVEATGHSFGEWTETKAPSCEETGLETRSCDCGEVETREISALGHNYESVVTKPTCTEEGYTTHTCTRCGNTYVDSYVEATGHNFGDWIVTREPGCEELGEETRTCDCGEVETREISALGHNYESVVTEPTCVKQGYTTHTCTRCGDSYTDSYKPATGHNFGSWTVTKAPTCTEKGEEIRTCSVCGTTQQRAVEALGHDYAAVVTAPTCTEDGYTTHTCTRCDDSYVDSYVNATGHTFGDWTETKAPTCTETGSETRTCHCGAVETREIPALGHTEQIIPGYAATCTGEGLTDGLVCTVCGETLAEQEIIPAAGHDYQDGICGECGAEDPDYMEPTEPEPTEPAEPETDNTPSWMKLLKKLFSWLTPNDPEPTEPTEPSVPETTEPAPEQKPNRKPLWEILFGWLLP